MTTYELLAPMANYLATIHSLGFRLADVEYIALYTDYLHLCKENFKKTYIVAHLAEQYQLSERKVYNLLALFTTPAPPAQIVQSLPSSFFGQAIAHY